MPVSFNEFSEALLLERKFDAEMGQAAEKSYDILSEKLIDGLERLGAYLIQILQKEEGDLNFTEKNLRSDIYLYCGHGNYIPGGFYEKSMYDARMLGHSLHNFLKYSIREKASDLFSMEESRIIDNNRSVFAIRNSPELIVLPKSIKPKQLADIFGTNQPSITINLHTSENVQEVSKTDSALGTYRTPVQNLKGGNGLPPRRFHLEDARINLAGFTCLDLENILPLARYLTKNRDRPTLMRTSVKEWINIAKNNLRQAKSVYIHEYTHFFDDIRMQGIQPKNVEVGTREAWKTGEKDMGLYYKSDIEWNAHFQDTATLARSAIRDFMIAIPNFGTAWKALGKERMKLVGNEYIVNKPYQSSWNAMIADTVQQEVLRLLGGVSNNRIKMYLDVTQRADYPVNKKQEAQQMLNIFVRQGKTLLGQFFLYVFNLFLHKKSEYTTFMLKDEKFRKRFFNRILSVAEDMKAIFDSHLSNIKAGKFPSKQAWNKAIQPFTTIPGTGLEGLRMSRTWGNMKPATDAYLDFYSGTFMRTFQHINGPFDPNKPIPRDFEAFEGL